MDRTSFKKTSDELKQAILYSLFPGGKRLRPIIALEIARIISLDKNKALAIAISLECIHTYSLVHDDLPAMDNDDYRRGRPSNHKVYGEATAILVGDALQTLAFEIMANALLPPRVIKEMALFAGSSGIVKGQFLDLRHHSILSKEMLFDIALLKTSMLFQASVVLPYLAIEKEPAKLSRQRRWGKELGILFQLIDDLHDWEISDIRSKLKSNAVNVLGLSEVKEQISKLATGLKKRTVNIYKNSLFLQYLPVYIQNTP